MKALLFASLFIASVLSSSFLSLPSTTVPAPTAVKDSGSLMQFTLGLYLGSNLQYHIPTMPNCLLDALQIITKVNDTYNAVLDGIATQNPTEIGSAIVQLSLYLNDTLVYCGDTLLNGSTVLAQILVDVNNMTFLELAVERVGANLPTVLSDLQAVWDGVFTTGDYFTAGRSLGDVLRIFFNIQPSAEPIMMLSLGSVSWPFTKCGSSSDLAVSQVNLDSQPSKGASQGINILGQMGVDVTLKQVQIVTSLNGTPLNTQYDPNTSAFHAGDTVNYRFAVTIPSFAPSVIFICF